MSNHPHGLTAQEIKSIRRSLDGRYVFNAAKNMPYQRQFSVGDILVVRNMSSNKLVESGGVSEKYLVVHRDEADLVYCKRILSGGKLGQKVEMIATWDCDRMRFEPDPEKMESILMDQEEGYDPYAAAKAQKRKQDKVRKHNKSIQHVFKTIKEADTHLRNLKVGDIVYSASSYIEEPNVREVVKIDIVPLQEIKKSLWGQDHDRDADIRACGLTDKCVVTVKYTNTQYKNTHTIEGSELMRTWTKHYKDKPASMKD